MRGLLTRALLALSIIGLLVSPAAAQVDPVARGLAVQAKAAAQSAVPRRSLVARQRLLGAAVATTSNFTLFGTYRAPAAFDAVQLVLLNETNDTANPVNCTVAAPAQFNDGVNALDSAGSAILPTPVTWGTTNPRNPRNPGGGATSTLVTGASGTAPNVIEGRVTSDIIPLSSLARTDTPTAPPLLMVRCYGTNIAAIASAGLSGLNPAATGGTYRSVNPDHWCQYIQYSNQTAAKSGVAIASTVGATQFCPAVEVVYYLRGQRVITIADAGDSIDQGWCNTDPAKNPRVAVNCSAGLVNGPWRQLVQLIRDGGQPASFASYQRDGYPAQRFNQKVLGALVDGGAGISIAIIKPWSVNDTFSQADIRLTNAIIAAAVQDGVTPVLSYLWAGQRTANTAAIDAYIDAYKASGGITIDARPLVSADGSTTSNVISDACVSKDANGNRVDETHINDACGAKIAAFTKAELNRAGLLQ